MQKKTDKIQHPLIKENSKIQKHKGTFLTWERSINFKDLSKTLTSNITLNGDK